MIIRRQHGVSPSTFVSYHFNVYFLCMFPNGRSRKPQETTAQCMFITNPPPPYRTPRSKVPPPPFQVITMVTPPSVNDAREQAHSTQVLTYFEAELN